MMTKRGMTKADRIAWLLFAIFCAVAITIHWDARLLEFDGALGAVKLALLAAWIAFVGYSVRCGQHERFARSLRVILAMRWGRQIVIDLYISMVLSLALVFAVTGSAGLTLFWAIGILPFANQALLLFLVLNVDRIAALLS